MYNKNVTIFLKKLCRLTNALGGRAVNILFNHEQLLQLIGNLYTLTGIQANIFNVNGKDICLNVEHLPFCERINAYAEGHARCEACDAHAVEKCREAGGIYYYRCHAGIREAVVPVYEGGVPLAYLVFGQLLDKSSMEQQWEETCKTLDWYPGDMEELHRAFLQFKQYSKQEIVAYAEILEALATYIHMEGMIRTTEYTDLQKLELYLDQHYMEKLSLATVSADLHVGRTKLCAMAKKLSGGSTLSQMIAERRVKAAKTLLVQSDIPISTVAEAVGISDYNYFTKVFRSAAGMTPRAFRKKNRHNREN